MLIMAPYLPSDSIPLVVYNMSSYAEGYTVLRGLNPLNFYEAGISLIPNFSEWYASFVINNWQSMKELVDITRFLYNGNDVMILTNPSLEFSNTLSEITVRQLHQIIADGLKNVLNPDIFALSLINRISKPDFQNSNIAVVDLRFVNEAAVLQQNGFTIIKIINHNNTKPIMAHNSEQEQVSIEPDYVLHNDGISIPNLQVAIYDMCKYFNWVD